MLVFAERLLDVRKRITTFAWSTELVTLHSYLIILLPLAAFLLSKETISFLKLFHDCIVYHFSEVTIFSLTKEIRMLLLLFLVIHNRHGSLISSWFPSQRPRRRIACRKRILPSDCHNVFLHQVCFIAFDNRRPLLGRYRIWHNKFPSL